MSTIRRVLVAWLAVLGLATSASAQATAIGWADAAGQNQPEVSWQVNTASNGIVPCENVSIVGSERRCEATFSRAAAQQIQLRARVAPCNHDNDVTTPAIAECLTAWSAMVSAPAIQAGQTPGTATVLFVTELPALPPSLMLVGDTSSYTVTHGISNGVARYRTVGYLAVASGTASRAFAKVVDWAGQNTSRIKIVVWNASGAVIGISDAGIVPATTPAFVQVTFATPFAVASGQRYYIGVLANSAQVNLYDDGATWSASNASGTYTYATPSGAMLGGVDVNAGHPSVYLN